jgi:hypothetical protein
MRLLANLQNIDRRIMYSLLIVLIAIPLIRPMEMPIPITPQVRGVYDAIEHWPKGKVAIVSVTWDAGTSGENMPQTEAIVRHLMMRHIKFFILNFWYPQGTQFAQDICDRLAREYGYEYGRDWCHFGFFPNIDSMLMGLQKNLRAQLKEDRFGTPIDKIPMMKGVRSTKDDIGLVIEITGSASLMYWISFVQGVDGTPLAYAPTAVMVAEGYNPLDAHQIVGMLPGMKGAGEYETLLKRKDFGFRAAGALSTSHVLIIVLIILGNLGFIAGKRVQASEEAGGTVGSE